MKIDQLLKKKELIRIKIDDIYDEIEYFKDLSKVIKLTIFKENPNFLLEFLNNEDNDTTNRILLTLNLTIIELKILSNVDKLDFSVKNELKQLKLYLKRLQVKLYQINKSIANKTN